MSRINKETFNENEIRCLSDRDAVRTRPGLYLGSVTDQDQGASLCCRELLDNALDEISAMNGDTIYVSNNNGGYGMITDNGRGIPIEYNKDRPDETSAFVSIDSLHAGSKFGGTEFSRAGQYGVGSSIINYTSAVYILMSRITEANYDKSIPAVRELWEKSGPRSKRDLFYIVVTEQGIKKYESAGKLRDLEKMIFKGVDNYMPIPEGQSTIVLFKPDPEIWEYTHINIPYRNLQNFLLIQKKFYNRKVNIIVNGEPIADTFKPYKYEVIKTLKPADDSMNPSVGFYMTFEVDPKLGPKSEIGSVNGLEVNQGQHIQIAEGVFKTALKDHFKIKHEYLTNGLQFYVVILAGEVVFDSQLKSRLRSISKVKITDFAPVVKEIEKIFKKNEDYWYNYVTKLNAYADSMTSIGAIEKAQRIIDNAGGNGSYRARGEYVEGFADATAPSNDRWNCELFLTEGLSPGGSLKAARKANDVKYRGVLCLRGKVLDTSDCGPEKMMNNKEFFTIFSVLGLGISCHSVIKDAKDPEEAYEIIKRKTRYGKLVIATDSDEDGLSIQKGIIYTVRKFAGFLIDFGLLYIAESPIFKQDSQYYYPSDPRIPGTQFCQGMDPSKKFLRYKGLGALEKEDVYYSFFDESTRRLIQVTPEYSDYAMGLVENIDNRKQLLFDKGILTNPYNFTDL